MYLDGFGKFLVIFVQKYFFTLVKKIWAPQKITFWQFLKNTIFSHKSDNLNRFLVKFPF